MTRKALIAKCNRRKLRALRQKANSQKDHFLYTYLLTMYVTGRRRGVIGRFGLSRIEARERINRGEILWVRKSSW